MSAKTIDISSKILVLIATVINLANRDINTAMVFILLFIVLKLLDQL